MSRARHIDVAEHKRIAASLVVESLALELRLIEAHEKAEDGSTRLGKMLLRAHRRTRRRQETYERLIRLSRVVKAIHLECGRAG